MQKEFLSFYLRSVPSVFQSCNSDGLVHGLSWAICVVADFTRVLILQRAGMRKMPFFLSTVVAMVFSLARLPFVMAFIACMDSMGATSWPA